MDKIHHTGSSSDDVPKERIDPLSKTELVPPYPGPRKTTTRKELMSYYIYFCGCTSLGPFIFASSLFQTLMNEAGHDPATGGPCGRETRCYLPFAGRDRPIASIILNINGITFAVQVVLFLLIGAFADYGSGRPWILIFFTCLAVGVNAAFWGLQSPSDWRTTAGMYALATLTYQMCIGYATAAFANLARDMPITHESEGAVVAGEKSVGEHEKLFRAQNLKVADVSFAVSAWAAVVALAIGCGILAAPSINGNENFIRGYATMMLYTAMLWLIFSVPWFLWEQRRPGRKLPPGTNYFTVLIKAVWEASRCLWQLKQLLLYLIAYFFVADTLQTTVSVTSTLVYQAIEYNVVQLTAITILGFGGEGIAITVIYYLQKIYKIKTKTMLLWNCFFLAIMCLWGLLGIWTHKIGFRTRGEFFAEQIYFGLFVTPWYILKAIMVAELAPHTHMYLFFSLFNVMGQTSSFTGPLITARIIGNANGNTSYAYTFLLPMCLVSFVCLWFVDVEKAQREAITFMEREAQHDLVTRQGKLAYEDQKQDI